jgi:hypothetical protein
MQNAKGKDNDGNGREEATDEDDVHHAVWYRTIPFFAAALWVLLTSWIVLFGMLNYRNGRVTSQFSTATGAASQRGRPAGVAGPIRTTSL